MNQENVSPGVQSVNKNSSVSTVLIVSISVFAVIGLLIMSYISNYNYGNEAENQIKAEYSNMENILAQYSLKVSEAAQVPEMKVEDLSRVTKEALSGRYGPNGSQAIMQWIQENYPGNVTDALYVQIQQIIEAGRDKFENTQTKFIDTKKVYETNLGYFWKGLWLRIAGYPKINLNDYKIISSEHAVEAFEKGVDTPVKLR